VFLGVEERDEPTVFRPRRARCYACGITQVLLDRRLLSRRKDGVTVIAVALHLASVGKGVGKIVWEVGRAFSTVRSWIRSGKACRVAVEAFLAGVGQVVAGTTPGVVTSGVGRLMSACARFALAAGWPGMQWLAAGASACRGRILQVSWWAQHQPAVAFLPGVRASSQADP